MIDLNLIQNYHLCTSEQSERLRSLGFGKDDGFPPAYPSSILLMFAIDYLYDSYGLRVEAFLTDICARHHKYTIRVSSDDGGNVQRHTSLTNYYKALSEAVTLALNLIS